MKNSKNLKLMSRASSSSSGDEKIFKDEKIQQLVANRFKYRDLFDVLLDESSMVAEESQCSYSNAKTIADLNLSPRSSSQPGCKCTKIDCLKLYCQCFAKGKLCNSNCICVCCRNCAGAEDQITHAKSVVNYRQPGYFKGVPEYVPARKCTCKKSLCRKKYCECYNAGLKCTEECQCCDCHNGKPEINLAFDSRMGIEVNA